MTQDELEVLPELGRITHREEIRDGKKVLIPVMSESKVLWQPENEPAYVIDKDGYRWGIGYHNGVRYKQRMWSL